MKKQVAYAIAICLLGAMLASSPTAAVEIVVWHSFGPVHEPIWDKIVDDFRREYPHIRVDNFNAGGYTPTFERLQVAYAAGIPPHISMMEQARTQMFADIGAVVSLTPYLEGPNGYPIEDFFPGLLDFVTLDGEVYAIPYNSSTLLNYYNVDMFREVGLSPEPPLTWDTYADAATRLARDRSGDGQIDVWGMDLYSMGWQFENWLGQNGARVLSEDARRFTVNAPRAVEAIEFLQDLMYHRRTGVTLSQAAGYTLFWDGRLGMAARSTAVVKDNQARARDLFEIGIAPMPCNVECYVSIGGANFSMINTGTPEERDAAWTFLAYISSTEKLAEFAASSGYMAARRSSVQSEIMQYEFQSDPFMAVTYQQLEWARARPKHPLGNLYDQELNRWRQPIFRDGANVVASLNEMNANLQTLLDDHNLGRRQ